MLRQQDIITANTKEASSSGGILDKIKQLASRTPVSHFLFYLAFGYFMAVSILGGTCFLAWMPNSAWLFYKYGIFILLIIGEVAAGCKLDNLPLFLLAVVMALLVNTFSQSDALLYCVFFIYCGRRIPFKCIAIEALSITTIVVLAVVFCSQAELILDFIWVQGERVRHGLGFLYCTTISHLLLNVVTLVILIKRESIRIWQIAVLLIIDVAVYCLTLSRNSFILVILLLAIACFLKWRKVRGKNNSKAIWCVAALPFLLFAIISLVLSVAYDPSVGWLAKLNAFSNNRISNQAYVLGHYGVVPFGQKLLLMGNGITADGYMPVGTGNYDIHFVDNSFMSILLHQGFFVFAVSVVFYVMLGRKASRDGNWWLAACLLVVAIHSLFDPQMIDLQYTTLMFLGCRYIEDTKGRFLSDGSDAGHCTALESVESEEKVYAETSLLDLARLVRVHWRVLIISAVVCTVAMLCFCVLFDAGHLVKRCAYSAVFGLLFGILALIVWNAITSASSGWRRG